MADNIKNKSNKKKKVIVGVSGGVDSSLAAALLKKQGYDVQGVFMKNFDPNLFFPQESEEKIKNYIHGCHWQEDQEDARQICNHLNIPFTIWNFEKEYYQEVLKYFFQEYEKGRTPNPDIVCNNQIKFGLFFEKALACGADFIATGHYARVKKNKDQAILLKGKDENKDQSYFLYRIDQAVLSKTIFPIGDLSKIEVRNKAKKFNLPNFDKKDSQGICFVGEVDLKIFLQQHIKTKPGEIVEIGSEKVLGHHQGLAWYTIGQRRGIEVGGTGLPLYVVEKDIDKNILYVVKGSHHPLLYKKQLRAVAVYWINNFPSLPAKLSVKVRYRQKDQSAVIEKINDKSISIKFNHPQRALTPGQSAVVYDNEICLGGGVISDFPSLTIDKN